MLLGPFENDATAIALHGPGDQRLSKPGRNFQDSDHIRRWITIQGLDWIRRSILGEHTSPADWKT